MASSGSGYVLSDWVPLYPGVARAIGNLPGQWVNAVQINLQESGISFLSTPSSQLNSNGVTVRSFLETNFGTQLQAMIAVNANLFDDNSGEMNTLYGLAYSQGQVVSPADPSSSYTLAITEDNTATILGPDDPLPTSLWTAVSGNELLVQQGQNVASDSWGPEYAARTAVGISPANGTAPPYLYILTIDGLESSGSLYGARLIDMAEWLLAAGVTDGFNLDGGGSTTMARIDGGTINAVLMNVPHGDEKPEPSERAVGNCFGVCVAA
ncbi:MAG TPA: phosphodiester glycosidase family protein [Beijerinckiaceae bacterium]|jgi:exopolysaccharide biosynthesis protein